MSPTNPPTRASRTGTDLVSAPDPSGCHDCGRIECRAQETAAAWEDVRRRCVEARETLRNDGPSDGERSQAREAASLERAACRAHAVDWRALYFAAVEVHAALPAPDAQGPVEIRISESESRAMGPEGHAALRDIADAAMRRVQRRDAAEFPREPRDAAERQACTSDDRLWCSERTSGPVHRCMRVTGHAGDHVSASHSKRILARWPQSAEVPTAAPGSTTGER